MFKVQGRLCHRIGSLLPQPESPPVYAQLYIYDPQEALEYRMNNAANTSLHRATMQTLQDMLFHRHPGVQLYKQAFELTQNMGPDQQCKIALCFDHQTDHHHYNLPTDTSNKIAVILPGDGDQLTAARDIILNRRGGPLQEISDTVCIPSIILSIMSFSFQLASLDGIKIFFLNWRQIRMKMATHIRQRQSVRANTSDIAYFPV